MVVILSMVPTMVPFVTSYTIRSVPPVGELAPHWCRLVLGGVTGSSSTCGVFYCYLGAAVGHSGWDVGAE